MTDFLQASGETVFQSSSPLIVSRDPYIIWNLPIQIGGVILCRMEVIAYEGILIVLNIHQYNCTQRSGTCKLRNVKKRIKKKRKEMKRNEKKTVRKVMKWNAIKKTETQKKNRKQNSEKRNVPKKKKRKERKTEKIETKWKVQKPITVNPRKIHYTKA